MTRLFQVGLVWVGCAVAWMILGGTLEVRSERTWGSALASVEHLWGPAAIHGPPQVVGPMGDMPVSSANARLSAAELPLIGSDVQVHLDHEQRRRGLNWFPTYEVRFDGRFTHRHSGSEPGTGRFSVDLARAGKGFDGFTVTRDGQEVPFRTENGAVVFEAPLVPGQEVTHRVAFTTRGVERWAYDLTPGTAAVEDFQLALTTDFDEVDFPEGGLSPTEHERTGEGWRGEWRFRHLLSGDDIAVELPRLLNPGPLAAKITFFGPVGLLFFFFVVAMMARVREISLHPMHYFFLGTGFFAFHLLFAYLVDQLPLWASFGAAAVVSLFLVGSYVRLVTGTRFARGVVIPAQVLYLVLFSASFFLEGMTGLTITIGAIGTLYVMMQLSARTSWETLAPSPARPPAPAAPPPPAGAPAGAPETF